MGQSTTQSNASIDKPITKEPSNIKPSNIKPIMYSKEVHDCYAQCIQYFDKSILPENDSIKNSWLDTIRKLHEIDGYAFVDIIHVTKLTREDDFWRKNFMSITKLRTKHKENKLPYIKIFIERFKKDNNVGQRKEEYRNKLREATRGI